MLFLHRARDLIALQRTQLSNMLRGLLAEFGIVIAQGIGSAIKFAKGVLDGDKPGIPKVAVEVLSNLSNQLVALHLRVRWYELRLQLQARQNPRVMLLRTIPGVGPDTRLLLTSAEINFNMSCFTAAIHTGHPGVLECCDTASPKQTLSAQRSFDRGVL